MRWVVVGAGLGRDGEIRWPKIPSASPIPPSVDRSPGVASSPCPHGTRPRPPRPSAAASRWG